MGSVSLFFCRFFVVFIFIFIITFWVTQRRVVCPCRGQGSWISCPPGRRLSGGPRAHHCSPEGENWVVDLVSRLQCIFVVTLFQLGGSRSYSLPESLHPSAPVG